MRVLHHPPRSPVFYAVRDRGKARKEREPELAREAARGYLEVELSQKTGLEAAAQRFIRFGLERERRVRKAQARESPFQVLILGRRVRIERDEHDRRGLAVARKRRGIVRVGYGVSDRDFFGLFEAGRNIPYLARVQRRSRMELRSKITDLFELYLGVGPHESDRAPRRDRSLKNPHVREDPFVIVVERIKHQRAQPGFALRFGRRHAPDDLFQ